MPLLLRARRILAGRCAGGGDGSFFLPGGGHVYACMTSDFFLPEGRRLARGGVGVHTRAAGRIFHHHHQAHTAHGGVPAAGLGRGLCKRGGRPHLRKTSAAPKSAWGSSSACPSAAASSSASRCWGRWTSPHGWTRALPKWWLAANLAQTPGKCATSGCSPCAGSACAPAWASTSSRRARTSSKTAAATASNAPCKCRRRKRPPSTFPGFTPAFRGYQ